MSRSRSLAGALQSGVVINEDSADVDFRVESNGATYALFVDGGSNHVNVMTSTDLGGVLNVSGDLVVNNGATNVVSKFQSTDGTAAIQLADNAGNVELSAVGNSFTVNPAGGASKLTVTNDGYVSMPSQPAFSVVNSSAQNNIAINSQVVTVFGTEIFDQNSDFSSNTFTAPVTGRYQLNGHMRIDAVDSAAYYYEMSFQTSNRAYGNIFDPDFGQDANFWTPVLAVLADMDANDTVTLELRHENGTQQTDIVTAYFSGYLVA